MAPRRKNRRAALWIGLTIAILVVSVFAIVLAVAVRTRGQSPDEIGAATRESWGAFLLELYAPRRESPDADCVVRLQELADRLTADLGTAPVHVSVALDSTVNAVSLPGRHVVVFNGLLEDVASENELTMILAHEIGHHEADHIVEAFARRLFLTFAAAGAGQIPVLGPILIQLGELGDLTFSRDAEHEADERALEMLQDHYGHVGGATDFFERRLDDPGAPEAPEFLSTHPLSESRVEELRRLARNRGYVTGDVTTPPEPCLD